MFQITGSDHGPRVVNSPTAPVASADFTRSTYQRLEESLGSKPPGSVAIIGVEWDFPGIPLSEKAAAGHWFNAFVDEGGNLRWADAQIGKTSLWPPEYPTDIRSAVAIVRETLDSDWNGVNF